MLNLVGRLLRRSFPVQFIFLYVFMSSGLVINFIQLISCILWPFSKKLYRKVNTYLAYMFWSTLTWTAQHWSGSDCTVYIENYDDLRFVNKEHSICIMNHKYDIDWLFGWIVCQRIGLLPGSKIIGKSSLKYVPIIGWCWLFTESIFIERKWETDQKLLVQGMDRILKDYPDGHFFNVLLFCEGTRFTRQKHEESMKIAREKGLPELKHHLLPRTKGMWLLAKGAEGRIDAIYDLNVGIEEKGEARATFNSIRYGLPLKGEIYIRRIPMSQVPVDEKECAAFVHKFYQEKDRIYDVYSREGTFANVSSTARPIPMPKNYYDCYIVLFWFILLVTPLFYYLYLFVASSSLLANSVLVLSLLIFNSLSEFFIHLSRSDAGSDYGLKKENKAD